LPRPHAYDGRQGVFTGKPEIARWRARRTMLDMAKKKPAEDQHLSNFMVRLPEVYRDQLRILQEQTRRSFTMDIRVALEEYLAKFDLWPPGDKKK
jgi:hypothetical protein